MEKFIPKNVISRVFNIMHNNCTGTCFLIDVDNKQYCITAKHVINDIKDGETIAFFASGKWVSTSIKLIGHHEFADISVFSLDTQLASKNEPLTSTSHGIIYGQDVFFFGFPYNMKDDICGKEINAIFPIPLVKKGIISSLFNEDSVHYLVLDGINNPGFSGGPVIHYDYEAKKMCVCSVISSFQSEAIPVWKNENKTDYFVRSNTGIILSCSIDHAIELIKANPVGCDLIR